MEKNNTCAFAIFSLISLLVIATIATTTFTKDTFIGNLLNDNFNKGCILSDRVYPSGKVPGSYLGLTQTERNGLLKDFINNKN